MSSDEQCQPCVVCNREHQQMLMLTCVHDPCINCAAIHYIGHQPLNSRFYTCPKCGQQTQLDNTSVVELQKIYYSLQKTDFYSLSNNQQTKKNKLRETQNQYNAPQNSNFKYLQQFPQSLSPATVISQPLSKYSKHPNPVCMCQDHPEDQMTYFCFSCSKPICPECAIHGNHKQHEVQIMRRAIRTIKDNLMKSIKDIGSQLSQINLHKQRNKKRIKDMTQENKANHEQIRKYFAILRNILLEKEKEFIRIVNEQYENDCSEVRAFTSKYDSLIDQQNGLRRDIQLTLKKEDILVLQEYKSKEEKVQKILSMSVKDDDKADLSTNYINQEAFQRELNEASQYISNMQLPLEPSSRLT